MRCNYRRARYECRAQLTIERDPMSGTITVSCPACERRAAGVCRSCPRPTRGKRGVGIYCDECILDQRTEARKRHQRDHPKAQARYDRKHYRKHHARIRREENARRRKQYAERKAAGVWVRR